MLLAQFVAQQRQDFIRAFVSAHYPVAIRDVGILGKFLTPSAVWRWDASVGNGQTAFVRTVEATHKEFWIDPREKDYRDAFKNFLQREYGVPASEIARTDHADHMFNKALAMKLNLKFVRMALVPATYNSGWGGKIERMLTNVVQRENSCYRLDCFIFMKVINIIPPESDADYNARRAPIAQQISGATGIPKDQILMAMDGIFQLWNVI